MPTLTIQLPGLPVVSHVLKDETITIGRMKGNSIVIEDASISLMHAKITRKDGVFFLKDLNSTNGTVVNGQPISEARLHDLDKVRFADVTGQFLAEAATAPSQPILIQPAPNAVSEAPPRIQPAAVSAAVSPAPSAAPSPAPARNPGPATSPMAAFNFKRLSSALARLVPYAGAATAVVIVSAVGWNLFHVDRPSFTKKATPETPMSLVAEQRAATDGRNKPAVVQKAAEPAPVPQNAPAPETANNESISHLIQALKNPEPVERRRAATTLHNMGSEAKEAGPALREALYDTDGEVQMWAALTLINNQSYDKAEIPVLIAALQHDNSVVRQVVCLSLALIPYEETEKETVVAALSETAGKDVDDDVRKAALSVLNIIAPDTVPRAAIK